MSTNETNDTNDNNDTNISNDSSDSHNQFEPFPTDGEERDHEAAEKEIGLSHLCVLKIGDCVFRYRGFDVGGAVVDRLSDPGTNYSETIPMVELWEAYQRGSLEMGEWQCQFIPEDEPTTDNE